MLSVSFCSIATQRPTPAAVFAFRVEHGKIVEIDMQADPERLSRLNVVPLES